MGRFLGQDPVFYNFNKNKELYKNFLHNPQAQNSYSYALNNPIKYTDPTGNCVGPLAAVCLGGVWLGSVEGIATISALSITATFWSSQIGQGLATVNNPESTNVDKGLAGVGMLPVVGVSAVKVGSGLGKYGNDAIRIGNELKQGVSNQKLINIIDHFYQKTDNLPFGTAGATAKEILNPGLQVGGKSHIKKAESFTIGLNKIISNVNSTGRDSQVAQTLLNKINTVLNLRK